MQSFYLTQLFLVVHPVCLDCGIYNPGSIILAFHKPSWDLFNSWLIWHWKSIKNLTKLQRDKKDLNETYYKIWAPLCKICRPICVLLLKVWKPFHFFSLQCTQLHPQYKVVQRVKLFEIYIEAVTSVSFDLGWICITKITEFWILTEKNSFQ